MRFAALYDIHGNLPALEAVLAEIARLDLEVILVGGDVVMGPMPRQTLERLRSLPQRVEFIQGNTERIVTGDSSASEKGYWAHRARWVTAQLNSEEIAFLTRLPKTLRFDVDGLGSTVFCHGSPRSDEEIITRATPDSRILPMVSGVTAKVVVCGHTHMQFDRAIGTVRLVNAGSVGMPYEGESGAYWALLGPEIEFKHTRYNVDAAVRQITETAFPGAEEFARENILNPPESSKVIPIFEQMAQERPTS